MFNVSKIQADLYGVVGWRQPLNPAYAILDADNLASRSGEYVTNNPYCKVEYLYDNQDYKDLSDAEFNERLKFMQQDSIASVCHQIFNKPDYIDRQVLFPYAQNRVNSETLDSGFVCYKIEVENEKNIAFEIKRVLLDFEGAGDIKIMLFNTSQDTPIEEQTVTISSTHQVQELNWKVDNSGNTYKGDYYIGYLTNTAGIGTLKPFKRDYENSDIKSNITHLCIDEYAFVGHTTETLPDLTTEDSIDECIGLNLDITVYDDFTDLIIQNESLLAHAINLDLQIKCIEMYLASLRHNHNANDSTRTIQLLISQIEGVNSTESVVKVTGLRPQLSRAISQVKKEIDKLRGGYFAGRISVDTLI
jgi:hypothetical protein